MSNSPQVITVLLVTIALGFAAKPVDFRQAVAPRVLMTTQPCTAPGLMCSDCSTVQRCVRVSLNPPKFTSTVVQTCNSSSYCLDGACVSNKVPNPHCQKECEKFDCPDYGMFPDPASWTDFHICVPEASSSGTAPTKFVNTDMKCENGYAYNAGRKVCSQKLTNNQLPAGFPVPICKTPGQTAALAQNPSIFYVCTNAGTPDAPVLCPVLQNCPNGGIYNSLGVCQ